MRGELYVKIAYWYYTLGLTQDEIAKRLSLTRQKVNQIISSLVELGIVSINIHGYENENVETECQIEEKYNLRQVIVASDYGDSDTAIYKVSNVAAQYLDESIQNNMIIGVSWGHTLAAVVNEMSFKSRSDCRVVQLMGAQNFDQRMEKSDEIARGIANKLNCASHILYAPVVVENAETKKWLLQEKSIKASFELMNQCDMAVLGVGELTEESTMYTSGYITKEDVKKLQEQGFVGDISLNPIRLDGSSDNCFLSERLLRADVDCLRGIHNVVLVATGAHKVKAIQAALMTGCIDTLIIDETTGKLVLADS